MKMLRWISGYTRKDKAKNDHIRGRVVVAPIKEKILEDHLRWFGYAQRRL